jgi:hypothetical protein
LDEFRKIFRHGVEIGGIATGKDEILTPKFERYHPKILCKLGKKGKVQLATARQSRNKDQRWAFTHFHGANRIRVEAMCPISNWLIGCGLPVSAQPILGGAHVVCVFRDEVPHSSIHPSNANRVPNPLTVNKKGKARKKS